MSTRNSLHHFFSKPPGERDSVRHQREEKALEKTKQHIILCSAEHCKICEVFPNNGENEHDLKTNFVQTVPYQRQNFQNHCCPCDQRAPPNGNHFNGFQGPFNPNIPNDPYAGNESCNASKAQCPLCMKTYEILNNKEYHNLQEYLRGPPNITQQGWNKDEVVPCVPELPHKENSGRRYTGQQYPNQSQNPQQGLCQLIQRCNPSYPAPNAPNFQSCPMPQHNQQRPSLQNQYQPAQQGNPQYYHQSGGDQYCGQCNSFQQNPGYQMNQQWQGQQFQDPQMCPQNQYFGGMSKF